ncbi:MAG: hypothetical protein ACRCUE_15115 [Bosea sp. (in: a-proteobacteria)]
MYWENIDKRARFFESLGLKDEDEELERRAERMNAQGTDFYQVIYTSTGASIVKIDSERVRYAGFVEPLPDAELAGWNGDA